MNPFNSAINTRHLTGTQTLPAGDYVYLGDFRICRYDSQNGVLFFKGQIMKNVEYAVRVEDFLKAVELPAPKPSYLRPEPRQLFKEIKY